MGRKLWMVVVATLLLVILGMSAGLCEEDELYKDPNFKEGIYFRVEYPGKDFYMYAGNGD